MRTKQELIELWTQSKDSDDESFWGGLDLQDEEKTYLERLEDIDDAWNSENRSGEGTTWRQDLCEEEKALVKLWDEGYNSLMAEMEEIKKTLSERK